MNKNIFIIIIIFIFLISNHLMDIADVVWDSGYYCSVEDNLVYLRHPGNSSTTNGLFNTNANIQYHASWYISYLCFFILVIFIMRDKK